VPVTWDEVTGILAALALRECCFWATIVIAAVK